MSKRSNQKTLDFFVKKAKVAKSNDLDESHDSLSQDQPTTSESTSSGCMTVQAASDPQVCESFEDETKNTETLGVVDLGNYINMNIMVSDLEKYNALTNAFVPGKGFRFPYSVHIKNNKEVKCYLSHTHFDSYSWLTFSNSLNGVLCKSCVLFAKFGGVHKVTPLQKLVIVALQKYSKLFGKDGYLQTHNNSKYHRESMIAADNFVKTYNNPVNEVINVLDTKRLEQIRDNRIKLKAILNTILFLGRQNLPLRGHAIQSNLTDSDSSEINEGNFRELVRYRINSCGDDVILKNHFETATARTKYISASTQNELIKCCGDEILCSIIKKVEKSKFYSIMFDETTDIANISQMTLVVRYLDEHKHSREDFLGFLDCHEHNYHDYTKEPIITGQILGQTVLSFMTKIGLTLKNCIGIGTDTCSVMLSDQKGAVSELQKSLKNASKCPCYNHSLNLSISKSSNVQDVRNCVGVMKEVISFFKASPKRHKVLVFINNNELISLCETRWAERHDSVLRFKLCFEKIIESLELISEWKDKESSSKARTLVDALLNTRFITSLICLSYFLSLTIGLSKLLQSKSLDKNRAENLVKDLIAVLNEKRENADSCFLNIYKEIETLHEKLNLNISMPRLNPRQTNRVNIPCSNPQEYFKRSIFIPLLDNVLADINFRFNKNFFDVLQINYLIPATLNNTDKDTKIVESFKLSLADYLSNFQNESKEFIFLLLNTELELWFKKWENEINLPECAFSALEACDENIFPNIYMALSLVCVMPVSVASAERSFSTLKRLKTWLRAATGQERLVGLALLHVHRDININIDEVLNRFAKMKNRHLSFII